MRTNLVLDPLEQALWSRVDVHRVVHHSGRGSQAVFNRSSQRPPASLTAVALQANSSATVVSSFGLSG
jgi:hypothetical protein